MPERARVPDARGCGRKVLGLAFILQRGTAIQCYRQQSPNHADKIREHLKPVTLIEAGKFCFRAFQGWGSDHYLICATERVGGLGGIITTSSESIYFWAIRAHCNQELPTRTSPASPSLKTIAVSYYHCMSAAPCANLRKEIRHVEFDANLAFSNYAGNLLIS